MRISKFTFLEQDELKRLGYDYEEGKYVSNIFHTPEGEYDPNMPQTLVAFLNSYDEDGWDKELLEDFIKTY
jgi:hypothetical protein